MITEFNIEELFRNTFGTTPYKVPSFTPTVKSGDSFKIDKDRQEILQLTKSGSLLSTQFNGVEIWLPVWFRELPKDIGDNGVLFLPYTVVKISGKKTIVKTALENRRGTVKEQYNTDDYSITIKGFLIDQARQWPEKELNDLKLLYEVNQAVSLDNALTNVFLEKSEMVAIETLEFPEVEGGRKHLRPFSMTLSSAAVFTLESQ